MVVYNVFDESNSDQRWRALSVDDILDHPEYLMSLSVRICHLSTLKLVEEKSLSVISAFMINPTG
ncbi:hypothetical protein DICVIV_04868 [Dictyocaulus viviparus]|uniref:Uncharacterized protein n=1 Tax=Dictyocaulus viviparus TaxID=29172 RepID=A0A0D8XYY0_DICVI|nr:hypothetical protein DICVIV_04868 [Dictyocaulus viviparus]